MKSAWKARAKKASRLRGAFSVWGCHAYCGAYPGQYPSSLKLSSLLGPTVVAIGGNKIRIEFLFLSGRPISKHYGQTGHFLRQRRRMLCRVGCLMFAFRPRSAKAARPQTTPFLTRASRQPDRTLSGSRNVCPNGWNGAHCRSAASDPKLVADWSDKPTWKLP